MYSEEKVKNCFINYFGMYLSHSFSMHSKDIYLWMYTCTHICMYFAYGRSSRSLVYEENKESGLKMI